MHIHICSVEQGQEKAMCAKIYNSEAWHQRLDILLSSRPVWLGARGNGGLFIHSLAWIIPRKWGHPKDHDQGICLQLQDSSLRGWRVVRAHALELQRSTLETVNLNEPFLRVERLGFVLMAWGTLPSSKCPIFHSRGKWRSLWLNNAYSAQCKTFLIQGFPWIPESTFMRETTKLFSKQHHGQVFTIGGNQARAKKCLFECIKNGSAEPGRKLSSVAQFTHKVRSLCNYSIFISPLNLQQKKWHEMIAESLTSWWRKIF